MTRFLVGNGLDFPDRNFTLVDWQHNACFARTGLGVEVEGPESVGWSKDGSEVEGARNEGSSRGGLQDSSSSNRRMPGGDGREESNQETQGGTRER
jgi:hypothetical protein